jgi:hypothetical protein
MAIGDDDVDQYIPIMCSLTLTLYEFLNVGTGELSQGY